MNQAGLDPEISAANQTIFRKIVKVIRKLTRKM